jgi:hypothetical protein
LWSAGTNGCVYTYIHIYISNTILWENKNITWHDWQHYYNIQKSGKLPEVINSDHENFFLLFTI